MLVCQFYKMPIFVQGFEKFLREFAMDLSRAAQARGSKDVESDIIRIERLFLQAIIESYKLPNISLEISAFGYLSVVFNYWRTITIGARNKDYIFLAYAIP